jgi:hypothetical protein
VEELEEKLIHEHEREVLQHGSEAVDVQVPGDGHQSPPGRS